MNQRELFLRHIAQTSASPLGMEIVRAEGALLFDTRGKEYIDLIGGISVANVGHRHPAVIAAIKEQLDAYLHLMVYGEFIESPQVQYAKHLVDHLPPSLNCVYFTNSGTEATEGAMKLAKRYTNRAGIIAFDRSYHGSTQGSLSIMGDEYWKTSFRPLLPGIANFRYNSFEAIDSITEDTACVIAETIQGEAGIVVPGKDWMTALRKKCLETGTLLILDEIQTGFGRTGKLWAFEHFEIVPDVLLLGKALGGGMPLGAFIADQKIMNTLANNPELGHITTFGGHPVCCAAGLAAMQALQAEQMIMQAATKQHLFESALNHQKIKTVRSCGLWLSVEFENFEMNKRIIDKCISLGALTDWFLFAPNCLRISPPLNISEKQIATACDMLLTSIESG